MQNEHFLAFRVWVQCPECLFAVLACSAAIVARACSDLSPWRMLAGCLTVICLLHASNLRLHAAEPFLLVEYWEQLYAPGLSAEEWYGEGYRDIAPFLENALPPLPRAAAFRILVLGCGTSSLSADLYDHGWTYVTSVDCSETCIAWMRAQNAGLRAMRWEVMDVRALTFENGSFDIVFEKGTLDSVVNSGGITALRAARAMLAEARRVLRQGGCFISVSGLRNRSTYLRDSGWIVNCDTTENLFIHRCR